MALRAWSRPLVCTFLLCAPALLVRVQGHGFMFSPASRNFLGSPAGGRTEQQGVITYTPHGGNGRGVCGDPYEGGGEVFANMAWGRLGNGGTYSPGQRVTMRVRLTANHGGRFAFQLCDRISGLDNACFSRFLTRADIPAERYWWLFTKATGDFHMDYVFPSDFSCPNGCVLRWEYVSTQTCTPPGCNPAVCGAYAPGGNWGSGTGNLCSPAEGLSRTELFYNCADIRISGTVPPPPPCSCPTASNSCQTGGGCNTATGACIPISFVPNGNPCSGRTCQNGACVAGCSTTCPTPNTCQIGGGCNTATRTCNPISNAANGSPCTGGTCQNGVCQSGCSTTCPTPTTCQTGGGCNTATRTCNPITNRADGTACTGGTCRSGVCQPTSGCTSTGCPTTTNPCQTGAGCNTATGQCNPITNRVDGTACTGGTCRSGVCSGSTRCTKFSNNGVCGNGVCCTAGNCCSSGNWCGATSAHCGTGCQAAWSGTGSSCNGIRVSTISRRRAAIAAAESAATNATLVSAETADPTVAAASLTDPVAAQPTATVLEAAAATANPTPVAAPADPAVVAASAAPVEPAATSTAAAVEGAASDAAPTATVVAPGAPDVAAAAPAVVP